MSQNVIIYRDNLLPSSETFIKEQIHCLKRFIPYLVGAKLVNGIELSENNVLVVTPSKNIFSKIPEALYKIWGYAPKFYEEIQRLNPVLVHAHFGPDGARAMHLVDKLKVPFIVTYHGFDITTKDEYARKAHYSHRQYLKKREKLKSKADLFLAVSDFIKDEMVKKGFPESKVIRHYIGIDTHKFNPDESIKREDVVLFVGRLKEVKGGSQLIRAMELVQKVNPEVRLIFLGDGDKKEEWLHLAEKKIRNFRFLGVVSHEEVKEWMNKARILCVPSITAQSGATEAFGIVFAEAQAMGLPVVSYRSGGIPEVVKHDETGLLAEEGNYQELADYILKIVEDRNYWNKLSRNSRDRVCKYFDITKQTRKLEQIYSDLIEQKTFHE